MLHKADKASPRPCKIVIVGPRFLARVYFASASYGRAICPAPALHGAPELTTDAADLFRTD
jgi:hypothetical protein